MTAWDGGTPDQHPGAPPSTGQPPRNHEKRRLITLVALVVATFVLVGLGVFLVGKQPTSETVSGTAGVAGVAGDTLPSSGVPPASAEASTPAPTTVPAELVDNSAAAFADLELHFANHDRLDLEAAYTGLTPSFAPAFDDFVEFWSVAVASVNSPIDGCVVTGNRGVCAVRFFITYSDAAEESVRNRCVGQSVELTMQRIDGRFLIDQQRDIGPLDCPDA